MWAYSVSAITECWVLVRKPGDVIITGDEPTETMMGDGLDVGHLDSSLPVAILMTNPNSFGPDVLSVVRET